MATKKFKTPLGSSEVKDYLRRVLLPLCAVFAAPPVYELALEVRDEKGWSFYGSSLVASAFSAGCDVLMTEDLAPSNVVVRRLHQTTRSPPGDDLIDELKNVGESAKVVHSTRPEERA